jgi:acetoin utilization deacetylase AcuC-like enzyme
MPLARTFDPELVLVSCGFDGMEGDPLGKLEMKPQIFAYMTAELMSLQK